MKSAGINYLRAALGLLAVLSIAIALNRTPAPAHAQGAIPIARQHGPIRVHQRRENQQYDSYNWAGYAVTGTNGSVTDAKGTWVVPAVTCTAAPNGYSSFWVGIDGFNSNSVEQTGTDSDCVSLSGQTGTPTYYAWFEFYPNPSYLIQFSKGIRPGDTMTAEVKFAGTAASGRRSLGGALFTVTITDVTQNETYTITSTAPDAAESSAEWIAEAPCCGRRNSILPLSDFNLVQFGPSTATIGSSTGAISSFGSNVQSVTMVSQNTPGTTKAQASTLNGGSFTVAWFNPGP